MESYDTSLYSEISQHRRSLESVEETASTFWYREFKIQKKESFPEHLDTIDQNYFTVTFCVKFTVRNLKRDFSYLSVIWVATHHRCFYFKSYLSKRFFYVTL